MFVEFLLCGLAWLQVQSLVCTLTAMMWTSFLRVAQRGRAQHGMAFVLLLAPSLPPSPTRSLYPEPQLRET
jgi:hypothetical protein